MTDEHPFALPVENAVSFDHNRSRDAEMSQSSSLSQPVVVLGVL